MTHAERSADTRARLLEAAVEVFAEEGFRGATIQRICKLAGANIAAAHYHFGDKEGLYAAVFEYAERNAAERTARRDRRGDGSRGAAARARRVVPVSPARPGPAGVDRAPPGPGADRSHPGARRARAAAHAGQPRAAGGHHPSAARTRRHPRGGPAVHVERDLAVRLLPQQRGGGQPTLPGARSLSRGASAWRIMSPVSRSRPCMGSRAMARMVPDDRGETRAHRSFPRPHGAAAGWWSGAGGRGVPHVALAP